MPEVTGPFIAIWGTPLGEEPTMQVDWTESYGNTFRYDQIRRINYKVPQSCHIFAGVQNGNSGRNPFYFAVKFGSNIWNNTFNIWELSFFHDPILGKSRLRDTFCDPAFMGDYFFVLFYENIISDYTASKPITVAARSKSWTVFARSNARIVGSNPT
jgi:hypothetical protein